MISFVIYIQLLMTAIKIRFSSYKCCLHIFMEGLDQLKYQMINNLKTTVTISTYKRYIDVVQIHNNYCFQLLNIAKAVINLIKIFTPIILTQG